jgi:lipopolysaccharide/colanic/teichoic acid biosynthesis glycosyltransferase
MSLVGPRPEVEKWVATYPDKWKQVLKVRPGMTDNASILYRNEEYILSRSGDPEKTYKEVILPHKLELYEEYVLNQTFWRDIGLLGKTIYSVVIKHNTSH